ncbi:MAG: helix-turn-helix domain-containing protein [Clostridiales bacterium]|nr:helix-turn-helix domain-containing protein [Clostridiales bacterium]
MDNEKIGRLIFSLRKEKNLTQKQLAELMNISDKAVSKWERGLGCPDVSLLPDLSNILGVNLEELLSGELDVNELIGGNMKKTRFYVCGCCGNLLTSAGEGSISCCGKKLNPLEAKKAEEGERLSVEVIDNEYFISSNHEMSKNHYISFVALLTGDSLLIRKQYPEWDLQLRLPRIGRGMLFWHCTSHGLFYQLIKI